MNDMETVLILTASSEGEAARYRQELERRAQFGRLCGIRRWVVLPDPPGRRIGSGGATLGALRELAVSALRDRPEATLEDLFARMHCLILHGGGEARRLPAYGACGKAFMPLPVTPSSVFPPTLFDLQLRHYLQIPACRTGRVIVTSCDVLVRFDPARVDMDRPGITGLACRGDVRTAMSHGVYAALDGSGRVRRYLQKPAMEELSAAGALDASGRAAVDTGILSLAPDASTALLRAFGWDVRGGCLVRHRSALPDASLDIYTELACGLGTENRFDDYVQTVQRCGTSGLKETDLRVLFASLRGLPFFCCEPEGCEFIDFGTTRAYVDACRRLSGEPGSARPLVFNCCGDTSLCTGDGLVEGTRLGGPLRLRGDNLVCGVDVPACGLTLPPGTCLDIVPVRGDGGARWVQRAYSVGDTFKRSVAEGCTFMGQRLGEWLSSRGVAPEHVWPSDLQQSERSLWNARLFPETPSPVPVPATLWMMSRDAGPDCRDDWLGSPRRTMKDISELIDADSFWELRVGPVMRQLRDRLPEALEEPASLSARELAALLPPGEEKDRLAAVVEEWGRTRADKLFGARVLHSLGSALALSKLDVTRGASLRAGARAMVLSHVSAMRHSLGDVPRCPHPPGTAVVAQAPLRLDLAGGWTDTPPYALEQGGSVVNAAVLLEGRLPVRAEAQLIPELCVRLISTGTGEAEVVRTLDQLMDYSHPTGSFCLAKAALALIGFCPEFAPWPGGTALPDILRAFGGGVELRFGCDAPTGSGLGASSILSGAVLGALQALAGRRTDALRLCEDILVIEQLVTTGGGWQDQFGGLFPGLKRITCPPGPKLNPQIVPLPVEPFCPTLNGGRTLLYYTGITRLAKGILQSIVGHYLDRDPGTLWTLRLIAENEARVFRALQCGDSRRLGQGLAEAWELNKRLDPGCSNERIEALMECVHPHVLGAKLAGAGGGGFLLMLCPDAKSATEVRVVLANHAPSPHARFYEFQVCPTGLALDIVPP